MERSVKRKWILCIVVIVSILVGVEVYPASLIPPPGYRIIAGSGGGAHAPCASVPQPYTKPLLFVSKYEGSDGGRDELNPESLAEYEKSTHKIRDFERGLSKLIDSYIDTGDRDTLACVRNWLLTWSGANALMSQSSNHTGRAVRKWALASLASAYLRLKYSQSQPLGSHGQAVTQIDRWIAALADQVVRDYQDRAIERMNNHDYWAGWAVMAAAVVLDRRDLFEWSLGQFRAAASQVDARGYLPNELKRQTRALSYHNYAVQPLVMIAAFAKANDVHLTELNDGALRRLVNRVLVGIREPESFERRTGSPQIMDGIVESYGLAWLEPYHWLFNGDESIDDYFDSLRPMKSTRLGGDLTALYTRTVPDPPKGVRAASQPGSDPN